jgi:hypothetical protein
VTAIEPSTRSVPWTPLFVALLAVAVPFAAGAYVDASRPSGGVREVLAALCLVAGWGGAGVGGVIAGVRLGKSSSGGKVACVAAILMSVVALAEAPFEALGVLLAGARFN